MRARGFIRRTPGGGRFAGIAAAFSVAVGLLLATGSPAVALGTQTATIQSKVSPSVSVGGSISDSAQLIGSTTGGGTGLGPVPTGTITFKLYGPDDAACATAVFTASNVPLVVQGGILSTAASGSFTPTAPGTYRFVLTYNGDSNYKVSSTACGDASNAVLVTDVTPKLVTTASPSVQAGAGSVTDTAALTGGKTPTGSITFLLFPPSDPSCSGNVVSAKSTVPVTDPSSIVSQPFSPTVAGTYHWVALYSGDTHNGAVNGACSDPAEAVVVTPGASTPGGGGGAGAGPGGTSSNAACDPVATAKAVLAGITATLTGASGVGFKNSCSAGLRIVLRAKDIRPVKKGAKKTSGFVTMANDLTHISPTGPALSFTLNSAGEALRSYALSHNKSLVAFLIVHVRKDKTTTSSESLQILTLG
jgi:hypothetical protein